MSPKANMGGGPVKLLKRCEMRADERKFAGTSAVGSSQIGTVRASSWYGRGVFFVSFSGRARSAVKCTRFPGWERFQVFVSIWDFQVKTNLLCQGEMGGIAGIFDVSKD